MFLCAQMPLWHHLLLEICHKLCPPHRTPCAILLSWRFWQKSANSCTTQLPWCLKGTEVVTGWVMAQFLPGKSTGAKCDFQPGLIIACDAGCNGRLHRCDSAGPRWGPVPPQTPPCHLSLLGGSVHGCVRCVEPLCSAWFSYHPMETQGTWDVLFFCFSMHWKSECEVYKKRKTCTLTAVCLFRSISALT